MTTVFILLIIFTLIISGVYYYFGIKRNQPSTANKVNGGIWILSVLISMVNLGYILLSLLIYLLIVYMGGQLFGDSSTTSKRMTPDQFKLHQSRVSPIQTNNFRKAPKSNKRDSHSNILSKKNHRDKHSSKNSSQDKLKRIQLSQIKKAQKLTKHSNN